MLNRCFPALIYLANLALWGKAYLARDLFICGVPLPLPD